MNNNNLFCYSNRLLIISEPCTLLSFISVPFILQSSFLLIFILAQVYICNGNCDEYGVARHPHSALYATTYADVATSGECPG